VFVDSRIFYYFCSSYLAIAPSTVRPGMVFTVQFSLLKAVPNARVDASITRSQTGTIVKSGANLSNGICVTKFAKFLIHPYIVLLQDVYNSNASLKYH